ncbi:hypothetical protein C7N43_09710 [Sphingobacteriales bacterium UPWRP_1]|nr:hypothetical protein B6N25_11815 [Sphingobacteriales bacterium TSM_CSS]PSJ77209.1 hypothetical protein C7N43_09710 [Sphingobacteriales bacterium UPWRP_1]
MKLHYALLVAILVWNSGCQGTPKTVESQAPESVAGISLIYENLGEDTVGIPRSVVLLGENGGAIVLDTLSLNLEKIEKEKYAAMGIPADAIDACGGWYAGGGDYFYVIKRNGNAVVYRGYLDEEQTDDGYHWSEIKTE